MTTAPESPSLPSRLPVPRALLALLVVLAALATYIPAIDGGRFHYDDGHHVVNNPAVHVDPSASGEPAADASRTERARYPGLAGFSARVAHLFTDPQTFSSERGVVMYRPVLMTSYAVDSSVHRGLTSWLERPVSLVRVFLTSNLLIHALVAVLVALLALRVGLPPIAALFAGLCMAVHPVFSEVVNYVSSRSESLAALWMLVAFHLHLSARARALPAAIPFAALAWIAALTATLAKETPALFCFAVAWFELVMRRDDLRRGALRALGWGAFYGLALGVLLLLRKSMLDAAAIDVVGRFNTVAADADPQTGGGRSILQNLLVQSRVVVLYLQFLIRPTGLSIDHSVAVTGDHTASTAVALLVHAGLFAGAARAWWRGVRLPLLVAGWFWLFLAPSVIVPLNVVMNEHRLYLPGIAVSLAVGAFLARVADALAARRAPDGDWRAPVALAALPFALFVSLAVHRSFEWHDDEVLWSSAVRQYPDSARARLHLGAVYQERAQLAPPDEQLVLVDRALDQYLVAERHHATWLNLQLNLANAWLLRARLTRADSDFEHALSACRAMGAIAGESTFRWRMLRAEILLAWKRYDEAEAQVRALDAEDDTTTPMYDELLSRILEAKGDLPGAQAAVERVLAICGPAERVEALLALGWWHMEAAIDGKRNGATQDELLRHIGEAEKHIGQAHELIGPGKLPNYRPKLYIARFLHYMGQPGVDEFMSGAAKMGWSRGERDVAWVRGGVTPNVPVGTYGSGRVIPKDPAPAE